MKLLTMLGILIFSLVPAACAGPGDNSGKPALGASLENTYWKLVEVYGKPVAFSDERRQAHVIFTPEGSRMAGSGGCNRFMGTYTVTEGAIEFGPIGVTHMACMDGMDVESAFLKALEETKTYSITATVLTFHASGQAVAVFEAVKRD